MIVESLISTEASLRVTCVLFLESHFSSLKIIFCSFNEHTQMSDYVTKAASFENIHSCCSLHSIVIDSVLIHLCQDSLKIYKKSRLDIISLQLDNISISVCSRHICSEQSESYCMLIVRVIACSYVDETRSMRSKRLCTIYSSLVISVLMLLHSMN